jgi:hypothetical protein
MKKIYKYELLVCDIQKIQVTGFIHYLKVAEQDGKLFLWCLVNTEYDCPYEVNISIVGTGNSIEDNNVNSNTYFDSVLMSNGLVWHVFIH